MMPMTTAAPFKAPRFPAPWGWLWIVFFAVHLSIPVVPAGAGVRVDLTDIDLERERVLVQSLEDGVLRGFGPDRVLAARSVDEILRIEFEPEEAQASDSGDRGAGEQPVHLRLIDGQRLSGRWREASGPPEDASPLRIDHARLGPMAVSLEQVRELIFEDGAGAQAAEERPAGEGPGERPSGGAVQDELIFRNGDRLVGFLASTGPEQTVFEDHQGQAWTLKTQRVARIRLANPPVRRDHDLVFLAGGDRVAVRAFTLVDRTLRVAPLLGEGERARYALPVEAVRRIERANPDWRLVELGDLTWHRESGGSVFGRPVPVEVAGSRLRLRAPLTLRFELPAGAARLGARVRLDRSEPGISEAQWAWASCRLAVRESGRALAEVRFGAAHPESTLNVQAQGLWLELELDPGVNGPILDRLVLEGAVVLVARE